MRALFFYNTQLLILFAKKFFVKEFVRQVYFRKKIFKEINLRSFLAKKNSFEKILAKKISTTQIPKINFLLKKKVFRNNFIS